MKIRSRLAWKLSAVVAAILAVAIAVAGYCNNLICDHYSLDSARSFLRFNCESIIEGIGEFMMSRNNRGIENLISEMSKDSEVYREIRVVSHHSGEVVACGGGRSGLTMTLEDRGCAVCHAREDLGGSDAGIVDMVVDLPDGGRALSVMAPIHNEPGCRTAECHAHVNHPPILGFLSAEYSLERLDAKVADRIGLIVATVLVSLVFGVVALWFMFARLLARPIKALIAGTQRIAANDLEFRFDPKRNDEIGVLEESFDTMTAKLQAHQDELHDAMCYLEGIVENSADIIITVTADGLIETFNHGAELALGYDRGELIGTEIEALFVDPRERQEAIARLDGTDNVKNYETRFLTKDGQVRNVLLTLSRMRDRQGNAIGTFGISKDLTQEKKLQQELVEAQKFAAIGQAVTGIQHAIKNMLNALTGGAFLVRNGAAKDDLERVEEGCEMVDRGIERISNLARNMLNYAREWKPEFQRTDLNDLVEKVGDLHRQIADDQGVALRCEVPDGLPAVLCDPNLIHMAVTDLLVNAIDACHWKDYRNGESPEVLLRNALTGSGKSVAIEVRDNGCGMNEEIRRNLFTPFFSTKKTRGTGLGLATTFRTINVHGGEISVESEPEKGTTFRLCLPIDGPREAGEADDGQASSHH